MFGVQELEHVQVWNASTLNWTHFTFIGLLDQLSLMFAYQSFGERVMEKHTWTKDLHGHPCNGRWFQRFFMEAEDFTSKLPG